MPDEPPTRNDILPDQDGPLITASATSMFESSLTNASTSPSDGQDPPKDKAGEKLAADSRQAYQVAATLYMQENTVTWARFNSMVAANAIIVAATGVSASGANRLYLLAIMLPVAGIALCSIWWMIMKRGLVYHDLWRASARLIEAEFLHGIRTLHFGHQLRNRTMPDVFFLLKEPTPVIPPGTARHYAGLVVLLFVLLYGTALLQVAGSMYKKWPPGGWPEILF